MSPINPMTLLTVKPAYEVVVGDDVVHGDNLFRVLEIKDGPSEQEYLFVLKHKYNRIELIAPVYSTMKVRYWG